MIKNTAIIGMGALGLLYGTQILKNLGSSSLYFVMDADRLARYRTRKFTVNGENIEYPMMDSKAAKPFDLVIVAVKYNELNSALQTSPSAAYLPGNSIFPTTKGLRLRWIQ